MHSNFEDFCLILSVIEGALAVSVADAQFTKLLGTI